MSTGKHVSKTKRNNTTIIIIVLLSVNIIVLSAVLCVLISSHPSGAAAYTPDISAPVPTEIVKNKGSISVPGYEALTLAANTNEQTLALSNPAQNTCLFEISLFLEDGTLLWKSAYIEPGAVSENIILTQTLSVGAYNAVLHYNCFTADETHKPLNSADTKLTLLVN